MRRSLLSLGVASLVATMCLVVMPDAVAVGNPDTSLPQRQSGTREDLVSVGGSGDCREETGPTERTIAERTIAERTIAERTIVAHPRPGWRWESLVQDERGNPVPRAEVHLRVRSPYHEDLEERAVTDVHGRFVFDLTALSDWHQLDYVQLIADARTPTSLASEALCICLWETTAIQRYWYHVPVIVDRKANRLVVDASLEVRRGCRIRGQVVDEFGQPVCRAEVEVCDGKCGTPLELLTTDRAGRFQSGLGVVGSLVTLNVERSGIGSATLRRLDVPPARDLELPTIVLRTGKAGLGAQLPSPCHRLIARVGGDAEGKRPRLKVDWRSWPGSMASVIRDFMETRVMDPEQWLQGVLPDRCDGDRELLVEPGSWWMASVLTTDGQADFRIVCAGSAADKSIVELNPGQPHGTLRLQLLCSDSGRPIEFTASVTKLWLFDDTEPFQREPTPRRAWKLVPGAYWVVVYPGKRTLERPSLYSEIQRVILVLPDRELSLTLRATPGGHLRLYIHAPPGMQLETDDLDITCKVGDISYPLDRFIYEEKGGDVIEASSPPINCHGLFGERLPAGEGTVRVEASYDADFAGTTQVYIHTGQVAEAEVFLEKQ